MSNRIALVAASLFCIYGIARAQGCTGAPCSDLIPPPAVSACDPSTQTLLTNNASVNSGQTFYYQGGTVTFSGVNVNGGTLIICGGPVTFDGFGFGTGSVIIAPGATVNFTSYYNAGTSSHYFYNYGTVNFTMDISIQGSTTHMVYNGPGGVINTSGRMDIINGGLVVNDGEINVSGEVRIQGSGQACLGNGSQVNTISLWVDNTNPISVPDGAACVSYSNQMQGNGTLTSSPCLILCQGPSASSPSNPSSIGSATLMSNCVDCSAAPLAVELISFELEKRTDGVMIRWSTREETTASHFILERRSHTTEYEQIASIDAAEGLPFEPESYSFLDTKPFIGINYYRLSEGSVNNGSAEAIAVETIVWSNESELLVFPNPGLSGENMLIQYETKEGRSTYAKIYSSRGVFIHEERLEDTLVHPIVLPRGFFILQLFENGTLVGTKRIVVI